jgi:hypothetical protein
MAYSKIHTNEIKQLHALLLPEELWQCDGYFLVIKITLHKIRCSAGPKSFADYSLLHHYMYTNHEIMNRECCNVSCWKCPYCLFCRQLMKGFNILLTYQSEFTVCWKKIEPIICCTLTWHCTPTFTQCHGTCWMTWRFHHSILLFVYWHGR